MIKIPTSKFQFWLDDGQLIGVCNTGQDKQSMLKSLDDEKIKYTITEFDPQDLKRCNVPFVSPRFLGCYADIRRNPRIEMVNENGYINLADTAIKIDGVEPGQQVFLLNPDNQYLYYIESSKYDNLLDISDRMKRSERILSTKKRRQEEIEHATEIIHFYAQYKFPFKTAASQIGHLNGLTPNSSGNGRNRQTVNHFLLEQDFEEGQLKRKKGETMCGNTGKDYSGQDNRNIYSYLPLIDMKLTPVITCKACLKILERWKITQTENP